MDNLPTGELLFRALMPISFRVHVTRPYWGMIVTIKHPVMVGHESKVQETLAQPDEIRRSRSDPTVYLFYKSTGVGRWICAVAKRLDDDGFLITTYPTDAIKEGVRVWPK